MQLNPTQTTTLLPQMFDILYANMSCIAPTGNSREEDWRLWQSYMASEQNKAQVILMYADDTLAGYFQYRIEGDTLCADEIEIRPQYQRTFLFYRFLRYAAQNLPMKLSRVKAYINKQNLNSQAITDKLGLRPVGENKSGRSWLYEGEMDGLARRFCGTRGPIGT